MKTILGSCLMVLLLAGEARADRWAVRWGGPAPCRPDAGRGAAYGRGAWVWVEQPVYQPGYWYYWQHPCGSYQRRWAPAAYRMVPRRIWRPAATPPPRHGR